MTVKLGSTVRSGGYAASDYAAIVSKSSYFRIAIPAWRIFGIHPKPKAEPVAAPRGLSREEVAALFDRDLNPRSKAAKLTETEERECALAKQLRGALYPSGH